MAHCCKFARKKIQCHYRERRPLCVATKSNTMVMVPSTIIIFIVNIIIVIMMTTVDVVQAGVKHYNFTEQDWDRQFSKGKWNYLGKVAVERARLSVIVGVYCAGKTRILDVGCGEGAVTDFLYTDSQQKGYVGMDISLEALKIAQKRRPTYKFIQAQAEMYQPPPGQPFDAIIFNEVLYYFDHVQILKQYTSSSYLAADGVVIISVWYTEKILYLKESIFKDARQLLDSLDGAGIDISGVTGAGKKKSAISFHIEAFKVRRQIS